MNLSDLRYLIAIADHLHFGRAAASCFVSQPTLSTQLRKLERELGVELGGKFRRGERFCDRKLVEYKREAASLVVGPRTCRDLGRWLARLAKGGRLVSLGSRSGGDRVV